MLYIVDDLNYQDVCTGIMCENCSLREMHYDGFWSCRIKDWIRKQPRFEDTERIIPIANITFDEDKMKEICEEAISRFTTKCPNCGTEIKPRQSEAKNEKENVKNE